MRFGERSGVGAVNAVQRRDPPFGGSLRWTLQSIYDRREHGRGPKAADVGPYMKIRSQGTPEGAEGPRRCSGLAHRLRNQRGIGIGGTKRRWGGWRGPTSGSPFRGIPPVDPTYHILIDFGSWGLPPALALWVLCRERRARCRQGARPASSHRRAAPSQREGAGRRGDGIRRGFQALRLFFFSLFLGSEGGSGPGGRGIGAMILGTAFFDKPLCVTGRETVVAEGPRRWTLHENTGAGNTGGGRRPPTLFRVDPRTPSQPGIIIAPIRFWFLGSPPAFRGLVYRRGSVGSVPAGASFFFWWSETRPC